MGSLSGVSNGRACGTAGSRRGARGKRQDGYDSVIPADAGIHPRPEQAERRLTNGVRSGGAMFMRSS